MASVCCMRNVILHVLSYQKMELGAGIAVEFPIKLKTNLRFFSKRFILVCDKKLVGTPKFAVENVILFINRKACNEIIFDVRIEAKYLCIACYEPWN